MLMRDTVIHRHEGVVLRLGDAEQVAVSEAVPAAIADRFCGDAFLEQVTEADRQVFIKQCAHPPLWKIETLQ